MVLEVGLRGMANNMEVLDSRLPYFIALPPILLVVLLIMVVVVTVGGSIEAIRQFGIIGLIANLIVLAILFTTPAWLMMFLYALYKDIKAVQAADLEWNPTLWQWLLGGIILSPLVGFAYLLNRQAYVGRIVGVGVEHKIDLE